MSQTFKILSLDGGGIRGLYVAKVLQYFEEKHGPIGEYFDMICGTSTGGLIALALSKRVPASELVSLYQNQGASIFQKKQILDKPRGFFNQAAGKGKYTNEALRSALQGVLEDTRMSEAQNLLCIPTFNLSAGRPRVFKYPHLEGGHGLNKYGSMMDAALATSAAPTYFPVRYTDYCYYADGGIWANDPTMCGILEALDHFVGDDRKLRGQNAEFSFSSYSVLSLACLPQSNGWAHSGKEEDLEMSFLGWNSKLISSAMDGQSHFTENLASKIGGFTKAPGTYYRIKGPGSISVAQQALLDLDNASDATIATLLQFGSSVGDHYTTRDYHKVAHFFDSKKTYLTMKDVSLT